MKFDTLWIKNGIHRSQLNNGPEIKDLIKQYKPKYAISDLKIYETIIVKKELLYYKLSSCLNLVTLLEKNTKLVITSAIPI